MSQKNEAQRPLLIRVLGEIFAIWIVSDIGFYVIAPILGIGSNFSSHPFVMAGYYLFWVGVTLITFWDLYKNWKAIEMSVSLLVTVFFGVGAVACYLLYIFPLFPAIHWTTSLKPPSELLSATNWYFLAKSLEIALQQLLVVAMILAFNVQNFSIQTTARWSATLFGGTHLLLVFSGASLAYVSVFTMSAVLAGFIFPYLILRVRNGFVYSYFLHWGFYAVVIVLARLLSLEY